MLLMPITGSDIKVATYFTGQVVQNYLNIIIKMITDGKMFVMKLF